MFSQVIFIKHLIQDCKTKVKPWLVVGVGSLCFNSSVHPTQRTGRTETGLKLEQFVPRDGDCLNRANVILSLKSHLKSVDFF